ncbi:hypothetical protein [Algoriphagus formosus]|uniref:hypothetical protein n=1 Tax=Algoriphagus formosus TaxID=2007308 RepID=UPI003F6F83EC
MKRSLLILATILTYFTAHAQEESSIFKQGVKGCYSDYYIEFYNRGADLPTDGEYEVVISVIMDGQSDCYLGKATIQNGQLSNPVYIQKTDGSYQPMSRMFKALDPEWVAARDEASIRQVSDGMSTLFYTVDRHWIRLFFPSLIAGQSMANKKAPPAKEMLKSNN